MVADLKFSIPETKIILGDLKEWVTSRYFSYPSPEEQPSVQQSVKEYRIYIFINREPNQSVQTYTYRVRRVIDQEKSHGKGARIVTERYIENWLNEGEIRLPNPTGQTPLPTLDDGKNFVYYESLSDVYREVTG